MKILFVSHQSEFIYGGEVVTLTLIEQLKARGHEIHFALPKGPYFNRAAQFATVHAISSVEFKRDLSRLPNFALSLGKTSGELSDLIKTHRFDAIHATSLKSFCYAALSARANRTPILWHHHDIMPDSLSNHLWLKSLSLLATKIAVPSNAAREALKKAGINTPIEVVYNGIDQKRFSPRTDRPSENEKRIIGFVGELSRRKGADWIPAIAKTLREKGQSAFVIRIIGEGLSEPEFAQNLKNECRDLEAQGLIEFLGRRNDVADQMRAFDLLIVPSRQDPLPTVVLEAMFSGVPVVGTQVGGISEMIDEQKTGRMASTLEAFTQATLDLLEQNETRVRMAKTARARAIERFSAETMAIHFERVLNFSASTETR